MEGFFEKYLAKLQEKSTLGLNEECQIWTGGTNGKYGIMYCQYPWDKKWDRLYVHRLSFMIAHGTLDLGEDDVSHLCHNTLCINPEHLVQESHGWNNSRMTCVSVGKCLGHPEPIKPCKVHLKMQNNNIRKYKYLFIHISFNLMILGNKLMFMIYDIQF